MGYKHSREEILEKGSSIIQHQGYTNTGISDILKALNIPKGTFYNFFDSKEEFVLEAIDIYADKGLQLMKSLFDDPEKDALGKLRSFYYDFMLRTNKDTQCRAACLINNLSYEMGAVNDIIAERLDQHYSQQVKTLAKVIKQGQKEGTIRDDQTASKLAEFIHTNAMGGMGRMKIRRSLQPLKNSIDMSFNYLLKK